VDLSCCIHGRPDRFQRNQGQRIGIAEFHGIRGQFVGRGTESLKLRVERHAQVNQVVKIMAAFKGDALEG
jgi:hypothetical protein